MLALAFFSWWYGQGWAGIVNSLPKRLRKTSHAFSVNLLLGTLFAPWRRIITYPGSSLAERAQAVGDNLVSRAVGFVVRLFVLLAAFITLAITAVLLLLEIIVWPLLPVAVIGFVVLGVVT